MTTVPQTLQPDEGTPRPARMPTAYITHGGGPCFFMDWDPIDAWDDLRAALEAPRGGNVAVRPNACDRVRSDQVTRAGL